MPNENIFAPIYPVEYASGARSAANLPNRYIRDHAKDVLQLCVYLITRNGVHPTIKEIVDANATDAVKNHPYSTLLRTLSDADKKVFLSFIWHYGYACYEQAVRLLAIDTYPFNLTFDNFSAVFSTATRTLNVPSEEEVDAFFMPVHCIPDLNLENRSAYTSKIRNYVYDLYKDKLLFCALSGTAVPSWVEKRNVA